MQYSYEIAVHRAGALGDEEEHIVALALRVCVVVVGGGRNPPEAGAAVERSLRSVASLLRPERGDGEVLRGVAEGEAPAVGLRRSAAPPQAREPPRVAVGPIAEGRCTRYGSPVPVVCGLVWEAGARGFGAFPGTRDPCGSLSTSLYA